MTDPDPDTTDNDSETTDTNQTIVEGEVISERTVDQQDSTFARRTLNSIEFRNLPGGEYVLVRVDDNSPGTKNGDTEVTNR